jgi:hypothetical protein
LEIAFHRLRAGDQPNGWPTLNINAQLSCSVRFFRPSSFYTKEKKKTTTKIKNSLNSKIVIEGADKNA